jgi:hypothetical protein
MAEMWVDARSCGSIHEAAFFRSVLEAAGIEAMIPDENALGLQPYLANAAGGVRLLVRAADIEKAGEVLQSAPPANQGASVLEEISTRLRETTEGILAVLISSSTSAISGAVAALTSNSGRNVHRIDLRKIASKYIGEAEKNLDRVFDDAERERVILVFDEADALFAARTEVSDAHDRYAGVDSTYLLKRVETFPGLVALIVSRRDVLEESFARHIDYVVELPDND